MSVLNEITVQELLYNCLQVIYAGCKTIEDKYPTSYIHPEVNNMKNEELCSYLHSESVKLKNAIQTKYSFEFQSKN